MRVAGQFGGYGTASVRRESDNLRPNSGAYPFERYGMTQFWLREFPRVGHLRKTQVDRCASPRGRQVRGVAAISPRDAWAVGDIDQTPLTLHWDGAAWRAVPGFDFTDPDIYAERLRQPARARASSAYYRTFLTHELPRLIARGDRSYQLAVPSLLLMGESSAIDRVLAPETAGLLQVRYLIASLHGCPAPQSLYCWPFGLDGRRAISPVDVLPTTRCPVQCPSSLLRPFDQTA